MLGAGADARPADPRPAPQGPAQRPVRAAEIHAEAHLADGDAAALGLRHAAARKRRTFRNIVGHAKNVGDLSSLSSWTAEQFDPQLSWKDVAWIKERWGGKLILKGILDVEDAKMAVEHRRRRDHRLQPRRPPARRRALLDLACCRAIVDAVGDKIEVHIDGGIRSGQDVLKALALGAKGTYIGRPFLYGLGAGGKAGVTTALEIIRKELDMTMALCGKRQITDAGKDMLHR